MHRYRTVTLTKKELTAFLNEIILILQEDLTNGYLTRQECNDYINLLLHASRHIFFHYPDYHKEVQRMTKPLIYLPSMQIMDLEARIAEKDSEIAEMNSVLAENKISLAEKDSETASLRAKLAALTPQ